MCSGTGWQGFIFGRRLKILCGCLRSRRWRSVLLLYLVTFGCALPFLCKALRNTPLEPLYQRNETVETQRLLLENGARINASVDTLEQFSMSGTPPYYNRNTSKVFGEGIAISVVSVSRVTSVSGKQYHPKYLVQTVAKFLKLLNATNDVRVNLCVCNVDLQPDKHLDLLSLPKWLHVHHRFKPSAAEPKTLSYDDLLEKEKQDYAFCLEKLLATNMPYLMLVEDDALPTDNLFSVLKNILHINTHSNRDSDLISNADDFYYIKLYHPERLIGFLSFDIARISELISTALLLTLVTVFSESFLSDKFLSRTRGSRIPRFYIFAIFIYFVLLFICIGRYNILQLRRISDRLYHLTPAPSCCTPAILFSRKGASTVTQFLQTVTCKKGFAKDTALDQLVREQKLYPKLVEPNLFKHIGHFSSLRKSFLNPYII